LFHAAKKALAKHPTIRPCASTSSELTSFSNPLQPYCTAGHTSTIMAQARRTVFGSDWPNPKKNIVPLFHVSVDRQTMTNSANPIFLSRCEVL
jgi:hypothetical protein